ncbi:hypothetical protein [Bremerella sp.]|uniref:hypothetical protein n=1 Tax=Bremerella sp. TaxID=2795602 RepID=UPI00391DBCDB
MRIFSLLVLCVVWHPASLATAETPLDESNSWALSVPVDDFNDSALLDLRYLNETQSGENGFVRLSRDGNGFVRGDGEPVRFWIVGSDAHQFPPQDMDRHARWLAKLGVNMVRLHVTICDKSEGSKITDVNEELIDGVHRFIKSAKDNGIYVLLSPYYAHFDAPKSWNLPGGSVDMEGLLFIEPKLQDAYQHWTREFYSRENPYTGLRIKDDPTVAILQIHNEDSLFFWTMQRLPEAYRIALSEKFSAWLARKYGSTSQAWKAWGEGFKGEDELDDVEGGRIACLRIYDLTTDGKGAFAKRQRDTAEFLAEFQRSFYQRMGTFLREKIGCQQLLNATNWRTANDTKLKALERYSYHALDIDAENEYVGSDYQHSGPNDGYRIDPGDYLVNESVLSKPFEMCTNFRQEQGHPFIVTETAWKNPNRYQSEGPFLAAAYQSLTGIDGVAWFSCQTPTYETDPRKPFWRVGDQMSTHKWNHCYPAMMAAFPANALLYRRGYLRQADPIVQEVRSLESLFNREAPRVNDNEAYGDQRSLPELKPGWSPKGDEINRAAFLVGPVMTKSNGDPAESQVGDLSQWFDPRAGMIRSITGELTWDYRRELCTMNSPKAQGVTGFLKRNGGKFELDDITIESDNDYATINVVSLDERPIGQSGQVLAQVVTANRLTGFRTTPATFQIGKGEGGYTVQGEQIERIGEPPFRIANTLVTLRVKNPALTEAVVLDINGYPVKRMPVSMGQVTLPLDAIYVLLRAASTASVTPDKQQAIAATLANKVQRSEVWTDEDGNVTGLILINHQALTKSAGEKPGVSSDDLKQLAKLPEITAINLEAQPVGDVGLAILGDFPRLKQVGFHYMAKAPGASASPDFITVIDGMKDLEIIEIKHNFQMKAINVHKLSTPFPKVWRLVLDTPLTAEQTMHMIRLCPNVTDLQLHRTEVTPAQLAEIGRLLPKLEVLWLKPKHGVTVKHLTALRGFSSLRIFSPQYFKGQVAFEGGWDALVKLPQLERLEIAISEQMLNKQGIDLLHAHHQRLRVFGSYTRSRNYRGL